MKFKKIFLCLMSLLLIFSTVVLGEEINKIEVIEKFKVEKKRSQIK